MSTASALSVIVMCLAMALSYWCLVYLDSSVKIELWRRKHRLSTAGTYIMVAAGFAIAVTRIGWLTYSSGREAGTISVPPPELILMSGASWIIILAGVLMWLFGEVYRMRDAEGPLAP